MAQLLKNGFEYHLGHCWFFRLLQDMAQISDVSAVSKLPFAL